MACTRIEIGRGTKVRIHPLEEGDCLEPTWQTLTVSGSVSKVLAPTFVPLQAALTTGVIIPSGFYVKAVTPAGKDVLLQLNARAIAGATSLSVTQVPIALTNGSDIEIPEFLTGRTDANLSRETEVVTLTTFDTNAAQQGRAVGTSATMELPGVFSQTDASYLNLTRARSLGTNVYAWVLLTVPTADYASGTVFKGEFIVGSLPVSIPAAGTLQGDVTLTLNGELVTVPPTPTAA